MRMNGFVVDVNSYFNSAPRPFKGMSHNPPRNEWHEVLNASNGTWIEAVAFLTRTKSLSCEQQFILVYVHHQTKISVGMPGCQIRIRMPLIRWRVQLVFQITIRLKLVCRYVCWLNMVKPYLHFFGKWSSHCAYRIKSSKRGLHGLIALPRVPSTE